MSGVDNSNGATVVDSEIKLTKRYMPSMEDALTGSHPSSDSEIKITCKDLAEAGYIDCMKILALFKQAFFEKYNCTPSQIKEAVFEIPLVSGELLSVICRSSHAHFNFSIDKKDLHLLDKFLVSVFPAERKFKPVTLKTQDEVLILREDIRQVFGCSHPFTTKICKTILDACNGAKRIDSNIYEITLPKTEKTAELTIVLYRRQLKSKQYVYAFNKSDIERLREYFGLYHQEYQPPQKGEVLLADIRKAFNLKGMTKSIIAFVNDANKAIDAIRSKDPKQSEFTLTFPTEIGKRSITIFLRVKERPVYVVKNSEKDVLTDILCQYSTSKNGLLRYNPRIEYAITASCLEDLKFSNASRLVVNIRKSILPFFKTPGQESVTIHLSDGKTFTVFKRYIYRNEILVFKKDELEKFKQYLSENLGKYGLSYVPRTSVLGSEIPITKTSFKNIFEVDEKEAIRRVSFLLKLCREAQNHYSNDGMIVLPRLNGEKIELPFTKRVLAGKYNCFAIPRSCIPLLKKYFGDIEYKVTAMKGMFRAIEALPLAKFSYLDVITEDKLWISCSYNGMICMWKNSKKSDSFIIVNLKWYGNEPIQSVKDCGKHILSFQGKSIFISRITKRENYECNLEYTREFDALPLTASIQYMGDKMYLVTALSGGSIQFDELQADEQIKKRKVLRLLDNRQVNGLISVDPHKLLVTYEDGGIGVIQFDDLDDISMHTIGTNQNGILAVSNMYNGKIAILDFDRNTTIYRFDRKNNSISEVSSFLLDEVGVKSRLAKVTLHLGAKGLTLNFFSHQQSEIVKVQTSLR